MYAYHVFHICMHVLQHVRMISLWVEEAKEETQEMLTEFERLCLGILSSWGPWVLLHLVRVKVLSKIIKVCFVSLRSPAIHHWAKDNCFPQVSKLVFDGGVKAHRWQHDGELVIQDGKVAMALWRWCHTVVFFICCCCCCGLISGAKQPTNPTNSIQPTKKYSHDTHILLGQVVTFPGFIAWCGETFGA